MATHASKKLKKRIHTMTTKRRRRRPTHHAVSARRRPPVRRRRKSHLGAGAPTSNKKVTLMGAMMNSGAGALGGAIYTVPKFVFKMPIWAKGLWAVGASVGLGMMKFKSAGAGISGAFASDLANSLFATSLKDDNLNDTQYVDPATLSDTGFEDADSGNAIMSDSSGNVYALNDSGEYQQIGTMQDLQDDSMSEDSNLQSVSMVPLQDPYSLNDNGGGAYLLQ